jgi:hypothetical protein
VLIVFGIVFPLIAWIATRRAIPLSISVRTSNYQLIILVGYIVFLSLYLVGGPQWIDQHFLPTGPIPRESSSLSHSRRSLSFSLPFLSRSFDSVSVTGFAISEFSARVYERFATVICLLSWLLAAPFLLSNIFSAAAARHLDKDILLPTNCFSVCRFASSGFSSKPD